MTNKNLILSLLGIVFLFGFIDLGSAILAYDGSNNVYRCGDIDVAGNYQMNQTIIDNPNRCLNITSSDVLLTCGAFEMNLTITEDWHIFVESDSTENITIENCRLNIDSGVSDSEVEGIRLSSVENAILNNVTLVSKLSGSNLFTAIFILGGDNILINNSILNDTSPQLGDGIQISGDLFSPSSSISIENTIIDSYPKSSSSIAYKKLAAKLIGEDYQEDINQKKTKTIIDAILSIFRK